MAGGGKRGSSQSSSSPKKSQTLRDEVREALLAVLRNPEAPPTAKAIAGRSLLQLLSQTGDPNERQPATELSIEELDEEIAQLSANPQQER